MTRLKGDLDWLHFCIARRLCLSTTLIEITVYSSTFLATYFINMETSSTNDIILLCNTAFIIGLVVVVPLQARGSWAGEIDPNLFPLQTQTASADLKGTRN